MRHPSGRLANATIGGTSGSYTYNGDGLRTSRSIGEAAVSYTWDVNRGLPVILEDSDGNRYVYGLDLVSVTDNSSVQTYFLYDGLGSTMALTDDEGTVTGTYEYDAFGSLRAHSGVETEWSYTGEQNDPTGLEYLRARYYDAATGRFASRDPFAGVAARPQSLNRYAYVLNNPLNFADPYGYFPWDKAKEVAECLANPVDCAREQISKVVPESMPGGGAVRCVVEKGLIRCLGQFAAGKSAEVLCPEKGHLDLNLTAALGIGGTAGLQCSKSEGWHPYAGPVVGFGASASAMWGPQEVTEGWSCATQASYTWGHPWLGVGGGGQAGYAGIGTDQGEPFIEGGIVVSAPSTFGGRGACYWVGGRW